MTKPRQPPLRPITRWLAAAPPAVLAAYAIACSFATYFAMFAFRKPFAAASYDRLAAEGSSLGLKSALVIGQVVGYGLAKWIGVKFISETSRSRRAPLLVLMIVAAEAALALFAVVPDCLAAAGDVPQRLAARHGLGVGRLVSRRPSRVGGAARGAELFVHHRQRGGAGRRPRRAGRRLAAAVGRDASQSRSVGLSTSSGCRSPSARCF